MPGRFHSSNYRQVNDPHSVCAALPCVCVAPQLHPTSDPNEHKLDFVLEAGTNMMHLLEGAYSCITLVKGVRDGHAAGAAGSGACVCCFLLTAVGGGGVTPPSVWIGPLG